MELDQVTVRMEHQAETIRCLVQGVTADQARRRPNPVSWSMVEVVNHLLDEEREDFRAHIDWALHRPQDAWTQIDPERWVKERSYRERDLAESLDAFLLARRESLDWLRGLRSPNWASSGQAPFGTISAGDLLASWGAHDLLHMRQLVELHYGYTAWLAQPYRCDYAGRW